MIQKATFGPWRVVAFVGEEVGQFDAQGFFRATEPAHARHSRPAVAATIEVVRNGGGMMPRGMISGRLEPDDGSSLTLEVAHTGDIGLNMPKDVTGLLGRRLTRGMPAEFAQAVLDGLVRAEPERTCAGRLSVTGGAYDEVDSARTAYELAGGLLRLLLHTQLDEHPHTIEQLIERLPRRRP